MRKTKNNISDKKAYIIIFILVSLAISVISYHLFLNANNGLPTGDSAWTINLSLQLESYEKAASIQISPPWDTQFARLFAQSVTHPELQLKRSKKNENKRDITLVASSPGKYVINVEFNIHVASLPRSNLKKTDLSELNRSLWLSSSEDIQLGSKEVSKILNQFPSTKFSTEELIEKLFNTVSNNVRILQYGNIDSEVTLRKRRGSEVGLNNALLALLRSAHLPARMVTGVNLLDKSSSQPYYWVEVYDNEIWLPLDPVHGYMKQLPPFYVPLRKGGDALFIVIDAKVLKTGWSIKSMEMPNEYQNPDGMHTLDIFNFNRLSPSNRENLGILLLLPLGVLATELLRQIIGIRTYGTFTPTLLALATVHVDRITALIVFSLVIFIGIVTRSLMPNFDLQRTARLAIVFTLVSASMSIVTSGLIFFDPSVDSIVVLLPVVILTMLVDRIYTVSDERGRHTAMVRLFWTLVAAFFSLLVLWQLSWSRWLVSYPETHLLTLACIILIGIYRGPKISELPLFYWLREPEMGTSRKTNKVSKSGQTAESSSNDETINKSLTDKN
jgi:transglutaminase-like putative cysteine protease